MCEFIFTGFNLSNELLLASKYGMVDVVKYIYFKLVKAFANNNIANIKKHIYCSKKIKNDTVYIIRFFNSTINAFVCASNRGHLQVVQFLHKYDYWNLSKQPTFKFFLNKCIIKSSTNGFNLIMNELEKVNQKLSY